MKKIVVIAFLFAFTGILTAQKSEPASEAGISSMMDRNVKISKEQLEEYEGTYELMPNFNLLIFEKGGKLISQATGQEEHVLLSLGDHVFEPLDFKAQITFVQAEDGTFRHLMLEQGGQKMKVLKIE